MADVVLFMNTLRTIHREEMGGVVDTVRALRRVTSPEPDLIPNANGEFVFGVAKARLSRAA